MEGLLLKRRIGCGGGASDEGAGSEVSGAPGWLSSSSCIPATCPRCSGVSCCQMRSPWRCCCMFPTIAGIARRHQRTWSRPHHSRSHHHSGPYPSGAWLPTSASAVRVSVAATWGRNRGRGRGRIRIPDQPGQCPVPAAKPARVAATKANVRKRSFMANLLMNLKRFQ